MSRSFLLFALLFPLGCSVSAHGDVVTTGNYSRVDNESDAAMHFSPAPVDTSQVGEDDPGPGEVTVSCRGDGRVDAVLDGDTVVLSGSHTDQCEVWIYGGDLESIVVRGNGDVDQVGDGDLTALASIDAGGNGTVHLTSVVVDALSVQAGGTGDVVIDSFVGGDLDLAVRGNGDVTMAGRVDHASIDISGNGDFHGEDLVITDLDISVSGSGSAFVNVTGTLFADISGSGDVSASGGAVISGDVDAVIVL